MGVAGGAIAASEHLSLTALCSKRPGGIGSLTALSLVASHAGGSLQRAARKLLQRITMPKMKACSGVGRRFPAASKRFPSLQQREAKAISVSASLGGDHESGRRSKSI